MPSRRARGRSPWRPDARVIGLLTVFGLFAAARADETIGSGTPSIFPPWQRGANNDAARRGLEFTVPEIDDTPDFPEGFRGD
jgi:hypothetical protein